MVNKANYIENISPEAQVAHAGLSPRELLLTAMGVLRNQQPFDLNWAEKTREQYTNRLNAA